MATSAARMSEPSEPRADPAAIRACLGPQALAAFDAEWAFVLDEAKRSHDLTGVHQLLDKWRFFAVEEARQPGWYGALVAKADSILHAGANPGAVPVEDLHDLIARRRGE